MECESDIVRRIQQGEIDLFEQIILKYQSLVYTICFNVSHNVSDAENTAQEAFIAVFNSIARFRGENLKAWICRIALNKAIDTKRKQSKIIQFEESLEKYEYAVSQGDSIEELFEKQNEAEKIKDIARDLPQKYASVIKDHYYGQLSVQQIASQQKIPAKTVETRLYRARKMIRERWDENDNP